MAQNDGGQNPSGGDGALGEQNPQGASSQQSASPSASATATGTAGSEPQGQGGLTRQAAERTVRDFYTLTSAGKYDKSARLLSESWRRSTFPNRAVFEGTFAEVESVVFIEGPTAEVSGNTATVTGRTRATKTDQIELNEGTWTLVNVGGEWRIDGWDVTRLSTRSR